MKILIIEDDKSLANSLKEALKRVGYTADAVHNGEDGQRRIELYHQDYDLVILDLLLPQKDGFSICRDVRGQGISIPILILTGKDSPQEKVTGLKNGADDYLTKPFSVEELVARIKAVVRRPKNYISNKLTAGPLVVDTSNHKVYINNKSIQLTLKEFALLEQLIKNKDRVLNREEIFNHNWDFASNALSNVVDVHINHLRRKISKYQEDDLIETVRGIGYKLKSK